MNATERKRRVIELLDERESVQVADLTELFSISKVTARNDLDDLEAKGLLVRTHGGAMAAEKHEFVRLISNTINENRDRKRRICDLAARFITPGQNIIIDSGSTTFHLSRLVAGKPITVITNSVLVIQELMGASAVELIAAGGVLRRQSMSFMGAYARHSFEQVRADILFLGAAGFGLEQGVTCTNLIEADTKQAMIRSASKVCLLADSSKLGKAALAKVCDWDSIDILVTDSIPRDIGDSLTALGVQVVTE